MGLIAYIMKHKGTDCSNGGLSSRHDEVTIVNADGPFDPTEDRPAVILVARAPVGTRQILTAYPAVHQGGKWVKDPRWLMMGGTYISCSDSRFGELCNRLGVPFYGAVALHDRYEG
jgi:hypothetical protein